MIPYEQFQDFAVTTDTTAKVDLGNGNLILDSIDGSLNTAGIPLPNERYFNSLTTYSGSQGGHWDSNLSGFDVGLQIGTSHAWYVAPSGTVETFILSGSTWTAPSHFNATLTTTSGSSTIVLNDTGETLTFNSSGWLTSDRNENGIGNTYTYNSSGEVTTVTEASGRYFTLSWTSLNGNTYISGVQDSGGRSTSYTHNSSGYLTSVTSPGAYSEQYSYDANGRVTEIQAVGPTTSTSVLVDFSYDTSGRVLSISQGTVGSSNYARTTTFSGWGASSTVSETDGDGNVTQWSINAYNIPKGETDSLGRVSSWTHDANGYINSYTGPNNATSTSTYNNNQVLIQTVAATGATTTAAYGSTAGCSGSGGTSYDPHCTTDPSGNTTAYTYDTNGNPVSTVDTTTNGTSDSTSATYATSAGGCYVTGSGSNAVIHGLAGQVCSTTSGNGNTTTYQYDASGNLTAVVPPAPLGITTYAYDSLGRVTSTTDGNGKLTTYTYNLRDKLLTTTYSSGAALTETWTPNGLEASSSQDPNNSVSYSYDALGQITKQTNLVSNVSFPETFAYDAVGNLTSYADQYGSVNYVYDADNELVQMIEPSGSCTTSGAPASGSGCIKFSYNTLGNEVERLFPGGAKVDTARDSSGRATRITATDSSGTVRFDKAYNYSLNGNDTADIQTATSYVETGIPASAVTTYTYDSQDRVTGAVEKTTAGVTNASWAYGYDADGNRTSTNLSGALGTAAGAASPGTITSAYNANDELTSTSANNTAWTYDADGNLLKNGVTGATSTYNDHGGVTGITTGTDVATYSTYGAGNALTTSRTDAGTTTNYRTSAGLGLMGEDYGSQRIYDRNPDGVVIGSRLSAGTRYYYIQDALGSVTGIFDSTGSYLGGYAYGPYGEPRYTGGNVALSNNHLRYISGYYDTSSGLYKLGARYYDASTGRFTQPDPTGQEANTYSYSSDNPINASDANGELSHRQQVQLLMSILVAFVATAICLGLGVFACALVWGFAAVFTLLASEAVADRDEGYSYSQTYKAVVRTARRDGLATFLGGYLTGLIGGVVAKFAK